MERFTFKHKETKETLHEVSAENLLNALCNAVKNGVDLYAIDNKNNFFLYKNKDKSSSVEIDGKCYIIEKDGSLFEFESFVSFDWATRYSDGATKIKIDGKWSLIEKNGSVLKDEKGRAKFEKIERCISGETKVTNYETGETVTI